MAIPYEIHRGLIHTDTKNQLPRFWQLVDNIATSDFVAADWELASLMWAEMRRTGKTVDEMDLLIAAYAKRRNAIVVTDNEKHFVPLGVPVENWLHRKEWL
ncbi:MAG: PIN domain-containing protein [Chloroflexota bacterium]